MKNKTIKIKNNKTMAKFIIGYVINEDNEGLRRFSNKKEADMIAEDWLEIEAESYLKATEKYEKEFKKRQGEENWNGWL